MSVRDCDTVARGRRSVRAPSPIRRSGIRGCCGLEHVAVSALANVFRSFYVYTDASHQSLWHAPNVSFAKTY